MKYSILGFNQKKVCAITKEVQINNKSKIQKLDMTDLIILQDISDFMNRKGIIKYTINEKIYFSITHNAILTDLPILDIKKQALKDRIDKAFMELGIFDLKTKENIEAAINVEKFKDADYKKILQLIEALKEMV